MTLLKCKMCGGDIQVVEDKHFGTCDSCGSTMTLPSISDERKANLHNRANHYRRQNEFDKALATYESILVEDAGDAEAHWGIVLSKFGIEYVEDPKTHKRMPTCQRVQATPILSDLDYRAAIDKAPDGYTQSLYEQEAKAIAEIQKRILAISNAEKPYDVFICYKETTDGGSRTKDSTLAQDIYYHLEKENLKVFFSRITLENKLGTEYEPYIFAALNSAKVMLVVGTKAEYFNAVWVKNEWSRFLALMKKDRSRLLIPCYRDMDAYDLPDELSMFQSQDMSKIGFIQDLVRGIKKVTEAAKFEPAAVVSVGAAAVPVGVAAASPVDSLLKRAFLLMEDGNWEKADSLLEQVLNIDPENAKAYIGKLMIELRIEKEESIAKHNSPIAESGNYQKAVRFASENERAIYEGYGESNIALLWQKAYNRLLQQKEEAFTEEDYLNLYDSFKDMNGYRDANELAEECRGQYFSLKEQRECEEKKRRVPRAWGYTLVGLSCLTLCSGIFVQEYFGIVGSLTLSALTDLPSFLLMVLRGRGSSSRVFCFSLNIIGALVILSVFVWEYPLASIQAVALNLAASILFMKYPIEPKPKY